MSYKILTKNAVENTNIDGARDYNFNAGRRSGIVKGAFNQGVFFSSSNNTIALDTCELRLCGHRVVIDEVEYRTLINTPSVPTRYSMIAQIIVYDNNDVSFDLFIQSSSTQLVQENLDVTGKGKFELEIGKFTQQTDGTITDIVRTADLITGGIGNLDGGAINIGEVTTNTLEPGMEAEVDVEERFDPKDKKTYTDFTFSIPKGQRGLQGIQGEKGEKGEKGDKGDKGDKGNTGATPVITATATTLSAGSSATVTKSGTAENPTLAFGIPKGDKGDKGDTGATGDTGPQGPQGLTGPRGEKGQKGDTGASAGFGTPTATIDSNVGTPSVTVTASGSDTSKVFNFAFKNLKGEKGDTGNTGATGATPNISVSATTLPAGSSATATISGSAESPTITFGIPKGDKGESGEIYQSTGTSTTGAMSQKATTDSLNGKIDWSAIKQSTGTGENVVMSQKATTDALDGKANKDLSNVTYPPPIYGSSTTGAGDVVKEVYISSNKKTWYRKWKSGWKECGVFVGSGNWIETTVTLPVTFSDVYYTCVMGFQATNNASNYPINQIGYEEKTVNTVKLYSSGLGVSPGHPSKNLYCCGY